MPVRIVTDSSSNLPASRAESLGITVVPLHVMASGKDRSTAGLSALELVAAYARQLERGHDDGVVAIHLSKELSSTWSNAVTAAGIFGSTVAVVDTADVGMGLGYAAEAAARAAADGADLDTCRKIAVDTLKRSHLFLYVHRVDELRRSGRMSATASLMSTALAIRPILHITDGRLEIAAKTRTQAKAWAKLVDLAVAVSGNHPAIVTLQQHEAREGADSLHTQLLEALPEGSRVDIVDMDSVLAVHSGPGAIAMTVLAAEGVSIPEDISAAAAAGKQRSFGAAELFGLLKSDKGSSVSDDKTAHDTSAAAQDNNLASDGPAAQSDQAVAAVPPSGDQGAARGSIVRDGVDNTQQRQAPEGTHMAEHTDDSSCEAVNTARVSPREDEQKTHVGKKNSGQMHRRKKISRG